MQEFSGLCSDIIAVVRNHEKNVLERTGRPCGELARLREQLSDVLTSLQVKLSHDVKQIQDTRCCNSYDNNRSSCQLRSTSQSSEVSISSDATCSTSATVLTSGRRNNGSALSALRQARAEHGQGVSLTSLRPPAVEFSSVSAGCDWLQDLPRVKGSPSVEVKHDWVRHALAASQFSLQKDHAPWVIDMGPCADDSSNSPRGSFGDSPRHNEHSE